GLRRVHADARGFGRTDAGRGRRVLVEYVSANPSGPLTVGSGRNGAVGETIARLLEALGYTVSREYYVNDYGNQMDLLARSVEARYLEALDRPAAFPEDGYRGAYVAEIARQIAASQGAALAGLSPAEPQARIGEVGLRARAADIR